MTNFYTEDEAKNVECPMARIFGDTSTGGCRGSSCAFWRWKPMMASDAMFTSAVKREMVVLQQEHEERTGKQRGIDGFHGEAVKRVMRDPAAQGIAQTHGYCGGGGIPT